MMTSLHRIPAVALLACALALVACGGATVDRFPTSGPMLLDPDTAHVDDMPREYWSGLMADGFDQIAMYPFSRFFEMDPAGPSVNVNAYDEVPDSSWFENRIGYGGFSLEDAARGACPEDRLDPDRGPWTIVAAKPNGANPGFIILDPEGRGWLMKFDGRTLSDERATSADVIGSRIYHAVGYHSPCNVIVYFDRDTLVLSEDAETEDEFGNDVPMTDADIDDVLAAAVRTDDGRFRGSASLFLEGRPIGPFTYQGVRRDDPNDAFEHSDRRDLRGARVLAAWLNHFDAREQNSLTMWHEDDDGHTWVKHFYLDFGDCFGSRWADDAMTRRFGFSYYFHFAHVFADWLSLGLVSRPWHTVEVNDVAPLFNYFDVEHFEPERWRSGYRNPAFRRMQDDDGAWMARILAMLTEDHLRVMIGEARMSNPVESEELFAILWGRRERVLDHYLRVRSPLAHPTIDGDTLCFTDLGALNGIWSPDTVRYRASMIAGADAATVWERDVNHPERQGPRVCLPLTTDDGAGLAGDGATDLDRYGIVAIETVDEAGPNPLPPILLHVVDHDEHWQLVGVERPADRPEIDRIR